MKKLDEAILELGSQKSLAEACGVRPMAVSLWRKNGVPAGRVISICKATGWKVKPHDLRPDIYVSPDWIPPEAENTEHAS